MIPALAAPLTPFADALPVPQRLVAAQQGGRLSVPIRAGAHRFHRDLPESAIWGYDGARRARTRRPAQHADHA